jgi:hypothetical protein
MPALRPAAFSIALLGSTLFSFCAIADPASTDNTAQASMPADAQPPLISQAKLDAWLKANASTRTPLDLLSPEAKQRFLADLVWGEKGLGGFGTEDLGWELTRSQIRDVLALFDSAEYERVVPDTRPASGWPARHGGSQSDVEQRFVRMDAEVTLHKTQPELLRTESIRAAYLKEFSWVRPETVRTLQDRDLLLFLRATLLAGFGPLDQHQLDATHVALGEAEHRNLTTRALIGQVQQGLLSAGQLDQAKALTSQYPRLDLIQIPEVVKANGKAANTPSWWRMDTASNRMIEEQANLQPLQLLVLAGCHFSEDAADDVAKDPELAPVFADHAHWLGRPPGTEDIGAWSEWNARRPHTPMQLITNRAQWKLFNDWNMPTFAVVRDGKVIEQTTGSWRNYPENRAVLVDMLRRHGLLPPDGNKTASSFSALPADAHSTVIAD